MRGREVERAWSIRFVCPCTKHVNQYLNVRAAVHSTWLFGSMLAFAIWLRCSSPCGPTVRASDKWMHVRARFDFGRRSSTSVAAAKRVRYWKFLITNNCKIIATRALVLSHGMARIIAVTRLIRSHGRKGVTHINEWLMKSSVQSKSKSRKFSSLSRRIINSVCIVCSHTVRREHTMMLSLWQTKGDFPLFRSK